MKPPVAVGGEIRRRTLLALALALAGSCVLWPGPARPSDDVCGNGVVEPGETCEDGNVQDGDCCSSSCQRLACPTSQSSPVSWQELGPWSAGGRVTSLAQDPADRRRLLAGTPSGGLWLSSDRGASWSSVAPWLAVTPISALAFAPSDPAVVLAGSGGISDSGTVSPGIGVIRSSDGGATWSLVDTGPITPYVSRLLFLATPGRVLAATDLGIRISTDGGLSWADALRGDSISDLARDPLDPLVVYGAGRLGLFRSEDEGASWSRLSSWPFGPDDDYGAGAAALAVSARSPGHLCAAVQVLLTFERTGRVMLLCSQDGGSTLNVLTPPDGLCATDRSCGFGLSLAMLPGDDRILLGGDRLFSSVDGGSTWADVGDAVGAVHEIVEDGLGAAVAGSAGVGILDGASSALEPRNQGLGITGVLSLDVTDESPPRLLAGTADSGSILGQGSSPAWTGVFGARARGGAARFDPFDASVLYASQPFGRLFRSDDGGSSFAPIMSGIDAAQPAAELTPFEPSPLVAGQLYTGRMELLASADRGAQWGSYRPPGFPEVAGISPSRFDSDRVYFWLDRSPDLYKADDIHTERLSVSSEPNLRISSVLPDPDRQNVLYVALTDTASVKGRVFKSYDFGQQWEDVSSQELPATTSLARDPFGALYVGTAEGVYRSGNDGFTWVPFRPGWTGSGVSTLRIADGHLYAGTSGRGVRRIELRDLTSIDTIPPGERLVVDGRVVTAPFFDSWSLGTSHVVAPYLLQTADTRREFDSWSDGGAASHAVEAGGRSLTAAIRTFHRLQTVAEPAGGGSLFQDPESSDAFHASHTFVSVRAAPNDSHRFVGFSGDFAGSDGVLAHAVMDRPRTVVGHFEPLRLEVQSDPPGLVLSVDGADVQTPSTFAWPVGSRHEVSAPALVDLHVADPLKLAFDGWSDLLGRIHSFTMLRDTFVTDLTAHYIPVVPQLEVPANATRVLRTTGRRDAPRHASLQIVSEPGERLPDAVQVVRGRVEGEIVTEWAQAPALPSVEVSSLVRADAAAGRPRLVVHNPSAAEASIALLLRSPTGQGIVAQSDALHVPAGGQAVRWIDELIATPGDFEAMLTVFGSQPVAVGIQEVRSNLRPSTFLDPVVVAPFTTSDRGVEAGSRLQALLLTSGTVHRLALLNPRLVSLGGTLELLDELGAPITPVGGPLPPRYALPPGGYVVFQLELPASVQASAQVRLTPDPGETPPLLQLLEERTVGDSPSGPLVLPRAIPPSRLAQGFAVPVDLGWRDSGVVLTAPDDDPVTVQLTLVDASGVARGQTPVSIPGGGQVMVLARELFPAVADDFRGALRGSSTEPVGVVGLLRHVNDRGEEILAGFPAPTGAALPDGAVLTFPFATDGDSWSSEWWFTNDPTGDGSVVLRFRSANADDCHLPMEAP